MPASSTSETGGQCAPGRVLIVEDEGITRRAMSLLLKANGYLSYAFESAEEAIKWIENGGTPGVALIDLDLPGMNGLQLIGKLAQLDPALISVLVTAAGDDVLIETLRERGVGYMQKPINVHCLLSLLSHKTLN